MQRNLPYMGLCDQKGFFPPPIIFAATSPCLHAVEGPVLREPLRTHQHRSALIATANVLTASLAFLAMRSAASWLRGPITKPRAHCTTSRCR